MAGKTILLSVADSKAVTDIKGALGDDWEATTVCSESDALACLEEHAFDVLLVDFNSDEPDATSQLLTTALAKRPETLQFLIAYESDLALVAAYVSGSHEILPKPIEPASLKSRIERCLLQDESNSAQGACASSAGTTAAPIIPAVYSKILEALDSPGVSARRVGEIIAEDTPLTYEVLRLTKSPYLNLPRNLNDPVKAVEPMGLATVKALVMALRFLAEHSHLKPGYLSFEKMWQHSINVAQLARDLMLFETKNRELAAEALVAGLLHDLGKVVLASNFDDLYARVHSLARNQPVALWNIEKEMFGASHAEIGACLVGMWNMPGSVVEAVAFHHEPLLGEHQHLTPLAAVHIANVLEHEIRAAGEFRVSPAISSTYLNEIRLLQRLPIWRAVFANRQETSVHLEKDRPEAKQSQFIVSSQSSARSSSTMSETPVSAAPTSTATSGSEASEEKIPVVSDSRHRRWVYVCAAAAALIFCAFWFGTQPPLAVLARAPGTPPNQPTAAVSSTPATELVAIPEPARVLTILESASAKNTVIAPDVVPVPQAIEPTLVTSPQATTTDPAPLAVEEATQPDFRLDGIIYSVHRPVAIVNGQTVFVGDRISGATVEAIGRNEVTLRTPGGITSLFLQKTR